MYERVDHKGIEERFQGGASRNMRTDKRKKSKAETFGKGAIYTSRKIPQLSTKGWHVSNEEVQAVKTVKIVTVHYCKLNFKLYFEKIWVP